MSTKPMLKDCPRTDPPCQATRPMRMSRTATAPAPSQMVRIVLPRICITNLLLDKEEGRGKREEGKPSLFRSGAKSAPIILPHHARSFPIFHPSLFPLPSSLSYRLLVRRSHTSPRDVPMSSHARNSLIRYVSVPSKIWVGSAHSPRTPRSGLTCTVD